ncbi:MAG: hypothetical protein ACREHD_17365, partial [Pirellulales bacterium]
MIASLLSCGRLPLALGLWALFAIAAWAAPMMPPMEHIGPRPRSYSDKKPRTVDLRAYAHVVHVAPDGEYRTLAAALAAAKDASADNRYAVLVAKGTYRESPFVMKRFVDLYGGFADGDWKTPDVDRSATILDAEQKGPVVIGADDARLDGFVVTGGRQRAHGGGIVC